MIAPRGTTSAGIMAVSALLVVVVVVGVKLVMAFGRRIALGARLGRRGERVVNVLQRFAMVSWFFFMMGCSLDELDRCRAGRTE